MRDLRRVSPRIDVEALCWETIGDRERSALLVDVSTEGARVERPFIGGRIEHEVPLQIEVPGIDEVMWAKGEVVFDRLFEARGTAASGGPFGLIRRTGYRIAIAAARDLRMLRDYVWDTHNALRARDAELNELSHAACYLRG